MSRTRKPRENRNSPEFVQYLKDNVIIKDGRIFVAQRSWMSPQKRKYSVVRGIAAPIGKFAWAIHNGRFPDQHVRHKDGNEDNNDIDNLVIGQDKSTIDKEFTERQKALYRAKIARGEFPGVCKHIDNRYAAYGKISTKEQTWIGSFVTPEEAAAAVKKFCEEHCPKRNPYNL